MAAFFENPGTLIPIINDPIIKAPKREINVNDRMEADEDDLSKIEGDKKRRRDTKIYR
ncbi:hypothetical protein SESBI_17392 [Sesbania bispinosa]|nr:hypothetical protein SESBI_17392 [Sesbania bispinosa]